MRPSSLATCVLVLSGALACEAGDGARRQWLQTTLVLDNQVFLDTSPELARGKFARMSVTPYEFFRGTVGQWARDVGVPGGAGYWPSAHATTDTADVALVGDPHLENVGSFRDATGRLVADFNDFDAAGFGPFHFDVRRLALSVDVAATQLQLPEVRDAAVRAVAFGYADEIATLSAGAELRAMTADVDPGAVLKYIFKKAAEDGAVREELSDYTRLAGDAREMYFGEVEPGAMVALGEFEQPVAMDETVPAKPDEAALAEKILAAYPACLEAPIPADQLVLKGLSRRLGAGVSSYPVLRLYALVEGPTAAPADDILLEIKEVFDAAPFPGLARLPSQPFGDDATRVVRQQRAMQSSRTNDPLFGCAKVGAMSFRVRDRTKYQRGIDLAKLAEKLAEGDFTAADIVVLAERSGRLLARSHVRAPKQDGEPALPALAAALHDDADGFVDETAAFVAAYSETLAADYAGFRELLADVGPGLGYAPAAAPETDR